MSRAPWPVSALTVELAGETTARASVLQNGALAPESNPDAVSIFPGRAILAVALTGISNS
jgi:hypothetical protein